MNIKGIKTGNSIYNSFQNMTSFSNTFSDKMQECKILNETDCSSIFLNDSSCTFYQFFNQTDLESPDDVDLYDNNSCFVTNNLRQVQHWILIITSSLFVVLQFNIFDVEFLDKPPATAPTWTFLWVWEY